MTVTARRVPTHRTRFSKAELSLIIQVLENALTQDNLPNGQDSIETANSALVKMKGKTIA